MDYSKNYEYKDKSEIEEDKINQGARREGGNKYNHPYIESTREERLIW